MSITREERIKVNNIAKVLDELKQETGKLKQEEIIKLNSDLPYFKEVLYFVYNTLIKTGISKSKINKTTEEARDGLTTLPGLMDYLKGNNTGKDSDLLKINSYLNQFDGIELEYLKGIVTKDLALGISRTTINKVFKGFIPKFDVMTAYAFSKVEDKIVNGENLNKEYAITIKLDGNRVVYIKDNEKFMSRSGKTVEGLEDIERDINQLNIDGKILDGEVIHNSYFDGYIEGAYAETSKVMRSKGKKEGLVFVVFDIVNYQEFTDGESKATYKERREHLKELEKGIELKGLKHIRVLPIIKVTNKAKDVHEELAKALESGEEGIMINTLDGKYKTKRVKDVLKVKQFYTQDLKCIDVVEEIRGGTLGAIVVEYKGNTVRVGSGFSHEQRQKFWDNKDLVLGKVIEVQGFEETSNQKGTVSLRFPTFVQVRDDKDSVSYH